MARGGKKVTPGGGYAGQANRTAPSSQYGKAAEQQRAQQVAPLPDVANTPVMPGQMPPLNTPTMRPTEPITQGASFGAGMNLDELAMPRPPSPTATDPRLYAVYLPQLEAMASRPNSSVAMRSFVRRLRATLPIDFDPTGEY